MLTGKQIRDARNQAGWSQEYLGDLLGVSMRTVGNWERGATAPQSREPELRRLLHRYLQKEEAGANALHTASDMELISELARRLARVDQSGEEVGDDDSSAATRQAAGSAAEDDKVHHLSFEEEDLTEEERFGAVAAPKDRDFKHDDPIDEQPL